MVEGLLIYSKEEVLFSAKVMKSSIILWAEDIIINVYMCMYMCMYHQKKKSRKGEILDSAAENSAVTAPDYVLSQSFSNCAKF